MWISTVVVVAAAAAAAPGARKCTKLAEAREALLDYARAGNAVDCCERQDFVARRRTEVGSPLPLAVHFLCDKTHAENKRQQQPTKAMRCCLATPRAILAGGGGAAAADAFGSAVSSLRRHACAVGSGAVATGRSFHLLTGRSSGASRRGKKRQPKLLLAADTQSW